MNYEGVVLLSGGLDSFAALNLYHSKGLKLLNCFIDYGQPSAKNEYAAVQKISKFYQTQVKRILLKNIETIQPGFLYGRNSFLIFTALFQFPLTQGFLVTGINSDTTYIDCTGNFIDRCQSVIDIYSKGDILLKTPFLNWKKIEIYNYCIRNKLPVEITYSCELGLEQPCGKCNSCKDLIRINAC